MRNHTEEFSRGINDDDEDENSYEENRKFLRNREANYYEDEFRGSNNEESKDDYYKETLMNIEDQVETSKLVLQLVTDSRFNMTQINGQRKLGGPPPGWKGPAPGPGSEVFVGKIPRTLYEHEIYPIFRRMGEVYEIRLMMDFSGTNRGYCFVMFGRPEFAQKAIRELDNFEIRPGRRIGVVASINNCRLYVGQLPPDVTSEIVIKKIYDITDDVGQVSVYRNANDQARYALISYKTHRGAAMARRRLVPDRASLFGGAEVSIDWAHPSMFPSNVVEDTGICDDHGNIEISRVVVGSENKRSQNRRRVRDDFLDHSIRTYLQTDRTALDHSPRNKQNLNNSLGSITRGINGFQIFDQNSNSRGQNNYQRHNSRLDNNPRKMEISKKSRDANSSFDLNVGSGSSESSGCSSQSSASERQHYNLSKEFSDSPSSSNFYPSQIFYNEGDNFAENDKFEEKIFGSQSSDSSDKRSGKKNSESLNLFDNYTFSANCSRDTENRDDFNDVENSGDDFSSVIFENGSMMENEVGKIYNEEIYFDRGEKCLPKIFKDSEFKLAEHKTDRENERKSREPRIHKSMRFSQKSQNFEEFENLKRENFKTPNASNFSNSHRPQSRNGIPSLVRNKNGKNSTAARLVAENFPMQHAKIANSSNPRNFHPNMNSNANKRAALLSAQLYQNCYDTSPNNMGNISNPEFSGGFITQGNSSQVMNFYPGQILPTLTQNARSENKIISNERNVPQSGRPILSRSYLCNEN